MKELVLARRAGVLAVAAASGLLIAAPALADVTVTPPTSVQGAGDNFTFHVTNTGTAPIGTVQLQIPADTPVAEIYPLSTDDWAPKIDERKLSSPLPTIHGGIPADEATSAITWFAMPGLALPPGKTADLSIAIGPLPTLSSMRFTIVTKYTNGRPGPAMSPVSVALTAPTSEQLAQLHAGHDATGDTSGSTATDDQTAAEDAQFAKLAADATRGPSIWSILGWVAAGLCLLGGIWLMLRSRHRAEEDDEPDDDEAGTRADDPTAAQSLTAQSSAAQPSPADKTDDTPATAASDAEPVGAGKWSLKQ